MAIRLSIITHAAIAAVVCGSLSACTVTETVSEGLSTTKDFLSSTTPGAWFQDGILKADEKVNAFVATNFENLKQDMAKGRGEYLASLSDLLGVPADRREAYFSYAQSRYYFVTAERRSLADVVAALTPEWL